MDSSEIRNDICVIEFFDMMQFRPATEKNYVMALVSYTDYMNRSPVDLIDDARQEIRSGRMLSERTIKRHLLGFRKYMIDKGMAPMSIKTRMSLVVSFYKYFDIEVPKIPRSNALACTLEENDRIPVPDQICEVLKFCDTCEKAIVLVGCSSGLSAGDVVRLTVKMFNDGYDEKTGITTIIMRRAKTNVEFVTFISPEASQAVLDYLKYRNRPCVSRYPHVQRQQEKQRVFDDSNYLFIKSRIPVEYSETHDEKLRQLSSDSIGALYRRISDKAGMVSSNGRNLVRSHNMRKVYNSAMLNDGADSFFTEYTMGHSLGGVKGAYYRHDPDKLADIFMKHVGAVTIQPAIDVESSEKYKNAIDETQKLSVMYTRESLKGDQRDREIELLRRESSDMREIIDEYFNLPPDVQELGRKLAQWRKSGSTEDFVFYRSDIDSSKR